MGERFPGAIPDEIARNDDSAQLGSMTTTCVCYAQTKHLWRTGIRGRATAGLGLVELAELDPPAADVVPDILLVDEESVESVAIEVCGRLSSRGNSPSHRVSGSAGTGSLPSAPNGTAS